jgi:hypothetical protein
MKLMTQEIAAQLAAAPKDQPPESTPIVVKYFCPWGSATWFITEGEQIDDDWRLFGFADLFGDATCAELGYVMLSELEAVRGPGGLTIERDLYFPPTTLAAAMHAHGK